MLQFNSIPVANTFAEAFSMSACALIITAETEKWALIAATEATGYAASVIGCDAEAGIDRVVNATETPDGRPGIRVLFFAFNRPALEKAVVNRVAQCVLTCPTTAVFNDLPCDEKSFRLGGQLRYFGDGWQIAKQIHNRRFWRVPTMDGEFLCEDTIGNTKGVAGGNIIIAADTLTHALNAAESAAIAAQAIECVILPFPGGVVRSGSKVGSKYKALKASTNEAYCPTLRGVVPSELPPGASAVYEIVIDGLTLVAVTKAMQAALNAATQSPGVMLITAGNYGGKLGPYQISLKDLLQP